jgi:microcystin-dependent protein
VAFIPPIEALSDSPTVCVQINKQWVSHVMGRVQALTQDWYWSGDDNVIYDAKQEGEKLMLALALGSEACMVRIGSIVLWPSEEVPEGYLLCDGSFISIAEYPELVAVIGTTYGEGVDTVALPNLTGRFPLGVSGSHALASTGGAETVTLAEGEMPAHAHTISSHHHSIPEHSHTVENHQHGLGSHTHTISPNPHTHAVLARANATSFGSAARLGIAQGGTTNDLVGEEASLTVNSGGSGLTGLGGAGNTSVQGEFNTNPTGLNTNQTGSGAAHNNMSPYLALNYIIRAQ